MKARKTPSRASRVAEEIRRVVATCLSRGEIGGHEEIDPSMIVVTDVSLSPCLRCAKIFVSSVTLGDEKCLKFLDDHSSQLRYYIGNNVKLKFVPEISFFIDHSFEYADKIEKLLKSLN